MSCSGCEQNVESALQTIDGVVDDDIHAAIEQAGYDVTA